MGIERKHGYILLFFFEATQTVRMQNREPKPPFSKPPDRTLRRPDTQSTGVCLGLAFNKGLGRNLEILLDCPLTSGFTHRQILPTIRPIIFNDLAFLDFRRW